VGERGRHSARNSRRVRTTEEQVREDTWNMVSKSLTWKSNHFVSIGRAVDGWSSVKVHASMSRAIDTCFPEPSPRYLGTMPELDVGCARRRDPIPDEDRAAARFGHTSIAR